MGLPQDDVSHVVGEAGGKVRYISSTEVVCIAPIYGPASQAEQYPSGTAGAIGSGAVAEVVSYDAYGGIIEVTMISGGRGYSSPPLVTFIGGGVFGNHDEWICDAIGRAAARLAAVPGAELEVVVCHYQRQDPQKLSLIDEARRHHAGDRALVAAAAAAAGAARAQTAGSVSASSLARTSSAETAAAARAAAAAERRRRQAAEGCGEQEKEKVAKLDDELKAVQAAVFFARAEASLV